MAHPTKHQVDPELCDLLRQMPVADISLATLADHRKKRILPLPQVGPTPTHSTQRLVVSGGRGILLHVYSLVERPGPLPCLFHIHGGGFIMGSAAELEGVHRAYAAKLGCVVIAVEYRLAPEFPYPAAIDDCYDALAWVFDHAAELCIDVSRIGIMGESAGGGLATALALRMRDSGYCQPAFLHLMYPMLDDRTGRVPVRGQDEFVWTLKNNQFAWRCLLGEEPRIGGVSPYAAPARATSLADLPPTFVAIGALDLFLTENLELVRRLAEDAVPVELHVYPRAVHGFEAAVGAEVARRARHDSMTALKRRFGVPNTEG